MVHFWLNWKSSEGGFTMCPTLPNKILQNLSRKIPSKKNVPWHRRWAALSRWSNCHFSQKNAFFGQKKAFFQKVHFIQKCSVTQNTIFQCIKNNFLLSNPKLVFFSEFNLYIHFSWCHNTVATREMCFALRRWDSRLMACSAATLRTSQSCG